MPERIYRWLLHGYPRAFRERYADEMMHVLRDRLRHEPRMRVWLDVLRDAAVSIPRQHLRRQPVSPRAPQWQDSRRCIAKGMLVGMALGAAVGLRGPFLYLGWASPSLVIDGVIVACLLILAMTRVSAHRADARFRVEATATGITIMHDDVALQTLPRESISNIEEVFLGLRIESASAGELFVPRRMKGYAPVRKLLAEWMPVTDHNPVTAILTMGTPHNLLLQYAVAAVCPLWFAAALLILNAWAAMRTSTMSVGMKLLYLCPGIVLSLRWWWRG